MFNKGVLQNDENDCGAAALATVLKIYKKNVPLYEVKQKVIHDNAGSSILELSNGAKEFGIEPTELTGTHEDLTEAINSGQVKFPFIAHVVKEDEQYHFIVILKQGKTNFSAFDPSYGHKRMDVDHFLKVWTGNLITFEKQRTFKKEYSRRYLFKSLILLKGYKKNIYISLFLTFFVTLCSIISAKFYQVIIDTHIMGRNQTNDLFGILNINNMKYLLLSFVALMLIQNLLTMLIEVVLTKTGEKLEGKLSDVFYRKLFSLPISFYQTRRTGDFITRLQDIETIVSYLSVTTLKFTTSIIMGIIGFVILSNIQLQLFLLVVFGLVSHITVSLFVIPKISKITKFLIEKRALLYSRYKENIDTIESIKVIQQENFFVNKIIQTSKEFIDLKKENSLVITFFSFIINNIENITGGLILYFGILFVIDNKITLGGFLSFQSLMSFFTSPIKELINIQRETQEYLISYERVEEFLEEDSENYGEMPEKLPQNNDIQFSNVTFSYNQRDYIINKFTKNIKEGSKIYIEGKNGSGKSTLTKLLTKIIIPNDGKIYLGNQDYETLPVNFVREKITYSTQDNYIFKGTLKENLFIDTTNDRQQKIIHSLVSDGILDNILSNFQNGWETLINEKGTNLSEGQKQIIGICRLLIIGSPIMIFDETISKIDNHTQEKLIDFIFDHFSKHTCIFIDHSAKMKERCTEVIKLDS